MGATKVFSTLDKKLLIFVYWHLYDKIRSEFGRPAKRHICYRGGRIYKNSEAGWFRIFGRKL